MLPVDHYELIGRGFSVEGKNRRNLGRELGHSGKIIRKVLGRPTPRG